MPERETTINPIGSGSPDISIVDAAIVQLTQEVQQLRGELGTQRSESKSVMIGVLFAFIVVVVAVAVQVIFANRIDSSKYDKFYSELNNQKIETNNLSNKIDNLKLLNYLK